MPNGGGVEPRRGRHPERPGRTRKIDDATGASVPAGGRRRRAARSGRRPGPSSLRYLADKAAAALGVRACACVAAPSQAGHGRRSVAGKAPRRSRTAGSPAHTRSGTGRKVLPARDVTRREGKANGNGACVWSDGSRYEGAFHVGKAHGRGVRVWPNGMRHDGEWHKGKPHGQGVRDDADGARYEGGSSTASRPEGAGDEGRAAVRG